MDLPLGRCLIALLIALIFNTNRRDEDESAAEAAEVKLRQQVNSAGNFSCSKVATKAKVEPRIMLMNPLMIPANRMIAVVSESGGGSIKG